MLGRRRRAAPEPADPPRVLVVADRPDVGELLRRLLGRAGHEVEVVGDVIELGDVLVVGRPVDCIVVDVVTGGPGGALKVLDTIRNHRDRTVADTPAVLLAEQGAPTALGWQAGADELLVRPFPAEALLDAVGRAMARPSAEREPHRRRQAATAESDR